MSVTGGRSSRAALKITSKAIPESFVGAGSWLGTAGRKLAFASLQNGIGSLC